MALLFNYKIVDIMQNIKVNKALGILFTASFLFAGGCGQNDASFGGDASNNEVMIAPNDAVAKSVETTSKSDVISFSVMDVNTNWTSGREGLDGDELPPVSAVVIETDKGAALLFDGQRDMYSRRLFKLDGKRTIKANITFKQLTGEQETVRTHFGAFGYDASGETAALKIKTLEGEPNVWEAVSGEWAEMNAVVEISSDVAVWFRPMLRANMGTSAGAGEATAVFKDVKVQVE